MTNVQISVAENEIRDLQRIIRATEAVLEMEKSPERRTVLAKELGDLEFRVDRLREKIENLPMRLSLDRPTRGRLNAES